MRRSVQTLIDRLSLESRLGPPPIAMLVVAVVLASPLFEPIWSGPGRTQPTADQATWLAAVSGVAQLAVQSWTPLNPLH